MQTEPASAAEPDEDEGLKPMPDRLMTELTAHRTLALRHALGEQPDVAFLAALHALCAKVFYHYAADSCLELDVKNVGFGAQAPGLNDTALAANFDRRHQAWIAALPKEPAELWYTLTAFDGDSRQSLFAHCVALSVNAMFEPYNRGLSDPARSAAASSDAFGLFASILRARLMNRRKLARYRNRHRPLLAHVRRSFTFTFRRHAGWLYVGGGAAGMALIFLHQ